MEPAPGGGVVLTGVVAFVDVWSANRTENYSKTFSKQLLDLGAKVSKTFNNQVTHVIFKDGSQSTWDKAVKRKVKLVSVLWVEKCRETVVHVEESVYPALNHDLPQLAKKRRKCMQPKDFVERTPENDKRLARRFDKMCKDLDVQRTSFGIHPLSFDDDGDGTLLYSPKAVVADRCNAMEKRIEDMRNKRENLSPTASQMSQVFDFSSLKPSIENSPTFMTDSPHEDDSSSLNRSYDDFFESACKGGSVSGTPSRGKLHVLTEDPIESITSKSYLSPQKTEGCKSSDPERIESPPETPAKRRKSNRFQLTCSTNDKSSVAPLTMNETLHVDFTSVANKAISKLSLDAVDWETASVMQISHTDQKTDEKVKAAHCTTDNENPADYSSLANRLITLCKEKEQAKKTRRRTLKSEVPIPYAKNKAVKVEADSHASCNTETDAFSNFEDFFTSTDLNNHQSKLSRFSLSMERRSPSPPPLTSNDQDCCKRRTCVGTLLQEPCTAENGKAVHSAAHSVSSPLERLVSNKNPTRSRKSLASTGKESPIPNKTKTSICLKESEVAENAIKIQRTSVKNSGSPATCEKTQDVPCEQETLYLTNGTDLGEPKKLFPLSVESTTSVSDAIARRSELFNEQRNKCTVESRKTEKGRKITRSLVMTSMATEKQSMIIQIVKRFGGFMFSDEVCESTTHVIAGSPRRTLNIVLGIARGCWILSYDWVLWSLECGRWIPEEPYELSDHFSGAPICRLQRHLSAGEYHQDLLSSAPSIFISPNSQPPRDKLSDMVQLCGGKVCKMLRSAKVCIGMFTGKKPPDLECISEKWLLDSITQHKLLPLQNYLLDQ